MSISAGSPQNQIPARVDHALAAPTSTGVTATAAGSATWRSLRLPHRVSPTESLPLRANSEARGRAGSEPEGLHKLAQSRSARQFE